MAPKLPMMAMAVAASLLAVATPVDALNCKCTVVVTYDGHLTAPLVDEGWHSYVAPANYYKLEALNYESNPNLDICFFDKNGYKLRCDSKALDEWGWLPAGTSTMRVFLVTGVDTNYRLWLVKS